MINECKVKVRDEKSYQKKQLEAGKRTKANAEHKSGSVPVELQQGIQPAGNMTLIQQAQEITVQRQEWEQKKTKRNKEQERVPKTAWKDKDLQQPDVLQKG